MKVVLASNNIGKIREFKELLKNFHLDLIAQAELGVSEIAETGKTFIENALLKARHAAEITHLPALADDSGLVVPALNGAPGIYSARYAGDKASDEDNIKKLLIDLKNIADDQRDAYFYCVLVFMLDHTDPTPLICTGKWSGKILREAKGSHGFGYNPIFFIPDLQKTAAEITTEIKNDISHRGIALQSLLKLLPEKLCTLSPSKI